MNLCLYEQVYQGLKAYVERHTAYDVPILQTDPRIYPSILFQEINNISYAMDEPYSLITFGIDIYTVKVTQEQAELAAVQVTRSLIKHASADLEDVVSLKRTMAKPIQDENPEVVHISMQYTAIAKDTNGYRK